MRAGASLAFTAPRWRVGLARLLEAAAVSAAAAALALSAASALAPTLAVSIEPTLVGSDGGHAFTFTPGFSAPWPYMVPSHPGSVLAPDDVWMTEGGVVVGALEPSHAVIRERGAGLHNLWEGGVWFSPSDDTDPRTNGRPYRIEVRTRLLPWAASARDGSAAALVVLLLCRFGPAAAAVLARAFSGLARRSGLGRIARWIPLTFGRTYALAAAGALGAFIWANLRHPMPLVMMVDSYGYVGPGLVWASGGDITGQSSRDLGYPLLTLLAVRLGSLADLPKLQLSVVSAGLACALAALYLVFASLASRVDRAFGVPRWITAVAAAGGAVLYVLMMSAHDLFIIDIDSAMAEAPHILPTALALILLLGGFVAQGAGRRILMLAFAAFSAYASVMVKPHTSLVLALCTASFVVMALRHRRVFRAPLVLGVCAALITAAAAVHRLDVRVTPPNGDFGPKTLFCNHLDTIGPVFETATPERLRIAALVRDVVAETKSWPVMGYDGDGCMYGSDFASALLAVSQSEGLTPARWEQSEFVKGVVRNPVGYGRSIVRQASHFLSHPAAGMTASVSTSVTDDEATTLRPFSSLIGVAIERLNLRLDNWLPSHYPRLSTAAKGILIAIARSFAPVTLGSTALAVLVLIRFRRTADLKPEIMLVTIGCFVAAFTAATALSHTFDVERYATDIFPFSLLWWLSGTAYLLHVVAATAVVAGQRRHPSP